MVFGAVVHCVDGLELVYKGAVLDEFECPQCGRFIFEAGAMDRCCWVIVRVEMGIFRIFCRFLWTPGRCLSSFCSTSGWCFRHFRDSQRLNFREGWLGTEDSGPAKYEMANVCSYYCLQQCLYVSIKISGFSFHVDQSVSL